MDSTNRRKLALIIGNGKYHRDENKLNNSIENAKKLSDKLERIGFNVTDTEYFDVKTEDEIMENVKNFAENIQTGDLIFFYFSGHSSQVNKKNYLLPIDDSDIDSDDNLKLLANNFQRILNRLADKKPLHTTILIFDCCRPYVLNDTSTPNREKEHYNHSIEVIFICLFSSD
jgi:uncharacterized caspase-like protein